MLKWRKSRPSITPSINQNHIETQTETATTEIKPVETKAPKYHKDSWRSSIGFKSLMSGVQEELQCCICLDEYKAPRLLQCGHCYCTPCLVQIQRSNSIRCPTCRYITKFPNVQNPTIQDLPLNYTIQKILGVLEEKQERHKKWMVCQLHKWEEVKFYCVDCQMMLCSECLTNKPKTDEEETEAEEIRDHLKHQLQSMKMASEKFLNEFQTKLATQLDDLSVKVQQELDQMSKSQQQLQKQSNFIQKEINQHFEEIVKQLETKKNELLQKSLAFKTLQERQLEQNVSKGKYVKERIQEMSQKLAQLLGRVQKKESGGVKDANFLWKEGPQLKSNLEQLLKEPEMERYELPGLRFQKKPLEEWQSLQLEMIPRQQVQYSQIFVKDVNGKTLICKLEKWELTSSDLFQKISEMNRIPMHLLRVYYQGKLLETGKQLNEYQITTGSTVHLSLSLSEEVQL